MTESKQALAARRRSTALVCSSNGMQTFWRVETAIAFAFLGTSTNSCIKHCTMLSRARAQASGQRASNTPATGHDDKQQRRGLLLHCLLAPGTERKTRFSNSTSTFLAVTWLRHAARSCPASAQRSRATPQYAPACSVATPAAALAAALDSMEAGEEPCGNGGDITPHLFTDTVCCKPGTKCIKAGGPGGSSSSCFELCTTDRCPFDQQVLLLFAIGSDAQHTHTAACYTTATEHRCKNGGTCVTRGYGYTNTPIFDKCVCTGGHTGTYCEK
eukprot:14046-Heterococcus_DN1.PRE.3